jgi:hypothetical protein
LEKKSEIHVILADHEFEILREDVGDYGARLNIAAKKRVFSRSRKTKLGE